MLAKNDIMMSTGLTISSIFNENQLFGGILKIKESFA